MIEHSPSFLIKYKDQPYEISQEVILNITESITARYCIRELEAVNVEILEAIMAEWLTLHGQRVEPHHPADPNDVNSLRLGSDPPIYIRLDLVRSFICGGITLEQLGYLAAREIIWDWYQLRMLELMARVNLRNQGRGER